MPDVSPNDKEVLKGVSDPRIIVAGRRLANATLPDSHSGDEISEASFAMDLSPLIGGATSDLLDFTLQYVDRLRDDIRAKLQSALAR